MPIKAVENLVAARIFLAGVILALAIGVFSLFFGTSTYMVLSFVLVLMGILVGYFVAEKDVSTFLLASVSVAIVSYVGISGSVLDAAVRGIGIGKTITAILGSLIALFVPATIVVAIKTVFSLAKS